MLTFNCNLNKSRILNKHNDIIIKQKKKKIFHIYTYAWGIKKKVYKSMPFLTFLEKKSSDPLLKKV